MQITGGSSSLFQGSGGAVTAFLPTQTVYAGLGVANGHFTYAASDSFVWRGLGVTAGSSSVSFSVDNAGLTETVTGLLVQRRTECSSWSAFAGATGVGFSTPYFTGSRAQHFGAGISYQRRVHAVHFSSVEVISGGQRTAIQSAAWSGSTFKLSGTAGWLNNQPLFNGTAEWQPVRALHFAAVHQDIFFNSLRATANNLSAYASLWHFTGQASVLQGTTQGRKITGQSLGVGARFGFLSEQTNFFQSNKQRVLVHTITETLRRWNFSQVISQSAGQTSYAFGGGYHGNRVSVSVDHSVLFFPLAGRGFQQVTSISVSLCIPHTDAAVSLSTNVSPTGKMLYSVSGSDYVQAHLLPGETSHAVPSGKFLLSGTVVDGNGQPVEGAALLIGGKQTIFTDSEGQFFIRVKHNKSVTVQVLTEQFATGQWSVVGQPDTVTPGAAVQIIVERL